ncbi:alpha/beta fold hydrolase [Brevundimonas sp.]|uniref:alpha/beta fold hydrolase n=1 Tax=Brevundimonas sp. TaxID=1871086 RepID=UPI0037C125A1
MPSPALQTASDALPPRYVHRPAPDVARLSPLVLLPGLLCDQSLWRPQIDALADRVAPMVADLTLDDNVADMARRVLAAAPPRFDLAALSMGGYVALEIMRQAPDRVRRLALIDTSARPDTAARADRRRAGIASLQHGTFRGVTQPLMAELVHASKTEGPVADSLKAMAARVGGPAFVRQQTAILTRPDGRPFLSEIHVPTLIAVGDEDRITPPEVAREMRDAIPGARLHVFDRCGHLPALEQPEETSLVLRRWLADA